jgi:hypothetical protein
LVGRMGSDDAFPNKVTPQFAQCGPSFAGSWKMVVLRMSCVVLSPLCMAACRSYGNVCAEDRTGMDGDVSVQPGGRWVVEWQWIEVRLTLAWGPQVVLSGPNIVSRTQ